MSVPIMMTDHLQMWQYTHLELLSPKLCWNLFTFIVCVYVSVFVTKCHVLNRTKQWGILLWLLLLFLKGVQKLMSALKISFPKRINNNEAILSCMPLICIWGQGLQSRSSTLFLKLELIWIPQEMWSMYIFMYLSCLIQSSLLFSLWQWMSECFRCSTCFLVLCVFQREMEDPSHGL